MDTIVVATLAATMFAQGPAQAPDRGPDSTEGFIWRAPLDREALDRAWTQISP